MKYPDYLSIGNWLFQHLKKDEFETRPVGGSIPENLYISLSRWRAMDLSKDLRTYEGLMEAGATEPDDKELLRLLKLKLRVCVFHSLESIESNHL